MSCPGSDAERLPQPRPGIATRGKGVRKGACAGGDKVRAASVFVLIKSWLDVANGN